MCGICRRTDGRADSGPGLAPTLSVPCALETRHLYSPSACLLSVGGLCLLPLIIRAPLRQPSFCSLAPHSTGHKSIVVGSKGCSKGRTQDAPTITVHSGPPGVLVASYAHFCSSNRCNRASSTNVLLNSLPLPGMEA